MKTGIYQGLDLHKDTTEISEVFNTHIFHTWDIHFANLLAFQINPLTPGVH